MFITTANSIDTIPTPLLDRMEVIEVPSYTEEEKLQIAKRHLLPKQVKEHGLDAGTVKISDRVMRSLIEGYTREAGVRTLERTIAKVIRKAAVTMLDEGETEVTVTEKVLHQYLGAPRFTRELPEKEPRVGIVNGLAVHYRRRRNAGSRVPDHARQGRSAPDGTAWRCDEGIRRSRVLLRPRALR